MQSHKGVEYEQARSDGLDSGDESPKVILVVEPQRGRCDDVQVELVELEAACVAERCDALSDHRQGVLSEVDEGRSWASDIEASEARDARGDRGCHLERQPRFRGLRSPTQHADTLLCPEGIDEPAVLGWCAAS